MAPGEPHRSEQTMTLEQWGDLPEDASGELVDGRVVEDEEVGALHDVVVGWLIYVLRSWLAERGGLVGASDTRFGVTSTRGRKPDLYVYFPGRKPPAHGLVTIPPDIMLEVVSPRPKDTRRDRIDKLAEYAVFGVRFYWIVDPAMQTLEIFELGADGRYAQALGATDGRVLEVPGCPELALDLDALWSETQRLQSD
jgi:Uma2 family endonuclease